MPRSVIRLIRFRLDGSSLLIGANGLDFYHRFKSAQGSTDGNKVLPFFFSQPQKFHIGNPGWRVQALCWVPAWLPEAHAFRVIGNDEGGDVQIGGEVSCKRVVAYTKARFVDERGKSRKIGQVGEGEAIFFKPAPGLFFRR